MCRVIDVRVVYARASCGGDREFESQRPSKSYTALQTVRHGFNTYAGSFAALTLWREYMGTVNSIHASA